MSEIASSGEGASQLEEKPVLDDLEIKFPPFPEPTNDDFDEDIPEEERNYYKNKFKDLNLVTSMRLNCTACDRHIGCSARHESRMKVHPMLRTLVCPSCHTFYNSGEFEKGDDGSELYCRWCGQGGQVYCCADCPHVFCAKCIKRNFGFPKIREIEAADDWKCFKCSNRCLWDLRAVCWALLRYCDLKNKVIYHTQNPKLKEDYQKESAIDHSQCCKNKSAKRGHKVQENLKKKPELKKEMDAKLAATLTKMPCTIQVKKFASINADESSKSDKKQAQKRPADNKVMLKNPISILSSPKGIPTLGMPFKKIKITEYGQNPIRMNTPHRDKPMTYTRIRPKLPVAPQVPTMLPTILNNSFNGFTTGNFNMINDNINLSLESLTQGLDMSAVAATLANKDSQPDDDVVCTPDFPLEPLCEVTEDNDDDVQCITPGPVAGPMPNPPPLVIRGTDLTAENIIQMTENDVTVNAATGGLKFRVDPQTLSSNKMYRLPDGRVFAINANPNMPGGYSATIVAVTDASGKPQPKGDTYAAKLSAVASSTPEPKTRARSTRSTQGRPKRNVKNTSAKTNNNSSASNRKCDLNVPVEWFRHNLVDAVDALEYALSRLNKIKKEATSVYLRSRNVNEMRNLHRTLERLLNTSTTRFNEVRVNLNKGLKEYVAKKTREQVSEDDEDDDVEILPDGDDDPIFIDENSVDSNINGDEVDLTEAASSEHNDSGENKNNDDDPLSSQLPNNTSDHENEQDSILGDVEEVAKCNRNDKNEDAQNHTENAQACETENQENDDMESGKNNLTSKIAEIKSETSTNDTGEHEVEKCNTINKERISEIVNNDETDSTLVKSESESKSDKDKVTLEDASNTKKNNTSLNKENDNDISHSDIEKNNSEQNTDSNGKIQDVEMSEEMIDNLLNDDNVGYDNVKNTNSMDIVDELQET